MIAIYWKYKGYIGDEFFMDPKVKLNAKFALGARIVNYRVFSWLSQKGYGPGYFNNSGVYFTYQKSVFRTEAERDAALEILTKHYCVTVFNDDVAFYDALKETKYWEKRMRKDHPY